jgi:hypothetical protein
VVHNAYHVVNGIAPPHGQIEQLLLPERAPQPPGLPLPDDLLRSEHSQTRAWVAATVLHGRTLCGRIPPRPHERALRALSQTVGISRHEAAAALNRAGWSPSRALRAQLGLVQVNVPLLLSLALQYAGNRGLVAIDTPRMALFRPVEGEALRDGRTLSAGSLSPKRRRADDAGQDDPPTTSRAVLERLRVLRDGLVRRTLPLHVVAAEAATLVPAIGVVGGAELFRLRQCEALDLIEAGDADAALHLIRTVLRPSKAPRASWCVCPC